MELIHILETAVNAIVPIVLLMAIGYVLRARGFFTDEFLTVANKFVFHYLIPISLFITAYQIENFSVIPWDIVIYSLLMLILTFTIGAVLVPLVTPDPRKRGALLQAVFRSNSAIIGIPLATVLGGGPAIEVAAVIVAFSLPPMNILAVLALSMYMGENGQKADIKKILHNIYINPIIRGVLIGMLFMAIRTWQLRRFGRVVFSFEHDLPFLYRTVSNMGSISSPFALIALGGQFRFSAAGNLKKEISFGVLFRCVVFPALVLGCAAVLNAFTPLLRCTTFHYPALIAQFGTPAAVSSAAMAGQMGNDQQLATQLVVWTSVASIFSLFAIVCILMATGLMAI